MNSAKPNAEPLTPELAEERKSILKELLLDDGDSLELLKQNVTRAKAFVQIDPHSGRSVLTSRGKTLNLSTQIRLVLMARRFASDLKIAPSPFLNYREIAEEIGGSAGSVSGKLTPLVNSDLITKNDDGGYAISPSRIDAALSAAESGVTNEVDRHGGILSQAPSGPVPVPTRRRARRARAEADISDLLSTPKRDPAEFGWIKGLTQKGELGLAGLYMAREVYGRESMTCGQLSALLLRLFNINATRSAINMGFNRWRGTFVLLLPNGKDHAYKLLAGGETYLLTKQHEAPTRHGSVLTRGGSKPLEEIVAGLGGEKPVESS